MWAIAALASLAVSTSAHSDPGGSEGFLEPYLTIDVASPEAGMRSEAKMREGSVVEAAQVVAELNSEVLEAALVVARATSSARGELESAQAELRLNETLVRKLTELHGRGAATQQEVDRAIVEREVAAARLLAVQERLDIRRLEAKQIEREIDVRRLRSPIRGVVTRRWKEEGEYVSPGDPVVITVSQLDPLMAVFAVPPKVAQGVAVDSEVTITFGDGVTPTTGVVEFVSPLIDPRSGTTQVKVRVPNPEGALRSGERCHLQTSPQPRTTPERVADPGSQTTRN